MTARWYIAALLLLRLLSIAIPSVWDNCRLIQNQAPAIVSWALSYCPFSISKKEVFVCLSAVISTALVVDIFDLVIHYIEEI